MSEQNLTGLRILVVEDDFSQSSELRDVLTAAGAHVLGPTGRPEDATKLIRTEAVDTAIVDINLGRGADFGIAYTLKQKNVPFVFLTGYDQDCIPRDFAEVPRIEKPARNATILQSLTRLTER